MEYYECLWFGGVEKGVRRECDRGGGCLYDIVG